MLLLSRASDPLVHYRRHFSRAVHAMCSIQALLTNGILHMGEEGEVIEESLTPEQDRAFQQLLHMVPHLLEHLMEASNEECMAVAELIQKGISSTRSDNTKSLKGVDKPSQHTCPPTPLLECQEKQGLSPSHHRHPPL
ncbi:hypothetical protein L208DRAFT_1485369, partial [Tricholoma matsutake]